MNIDDVKVQVACCPVCGNNILVATTKTTFERSVARQFSKLMELGYLIKQVSLAEARETDMYCDCLTNKTK